MPEHPEAALYACQLKQEFLGCMLKSYDVEIENPVILEQLVLRGKRIVLQFSNDQTDIVELSLTGYFCLERPRDEKHRIVKEWIFAKSVDGHSENRTLMLVDSSNSIEYARVHHFTSDTMHEKQTFLSSICKGFLGDDVSLIITKNEFQKALHKHAIPKKVKDKTDYLFNVLIDQKLVCSGLGNYLLNEIFHKMGLSPWVRCSQMWNNDLHRNRLFEVCRDTVLEAYQSHGSVGYRDLYGNVGKFEPEVYGRSHCKYDPLIRVRCENGPHGRSCYYTDDNRLAVTANASVNKKGTIMSFFSKNHLTKTS